MNLPGEIDLDQSILTSLASVKTAKSLRKLVLWNMESTQGQARQAIANMTAQLVQATGQSLTELYLGWLSCSFEAGQKIVEALNKTKQTTGIEVLNLSGNPSWWDRENKTIQMLCKFVKRQKQLRKLYLGRNELSISAQTQIR